MKLKKAYGILLLTLLVVPIFGATQATASEPAMANYTHYPIFQASAVKPNILIMLDNSGSMNFNAYGSWPGNGGIVSNGPYSGEPYRSVVQSVVLEASDDAEENSGGHTYDHYDLDLGGVSAVGLRFQNLSIPEGAIITKAHITFESSYPNTGTNAEPTSLTFRGQAADNAPTFDINSYDHDISTRPDTEASVSWGSVPSWTTDATYQSPDVSAIVQEIVGRSGWSNGNAIVIKVSGSGRREAKAYSDGPSLYVEYRPAQWTTYYGYFNPDYFYYWNSNKFDHKYRKVTYVGDPSSGGYWSVTDLNGNPHNLLDSEIVSSALWDGNWLNWLCMRRVDVLRKVLMGGLATSRSGGGNQVNYGEAPAQSSRKFIKRFNSSVGAAVSPYDGDYYYGMADGNIHVDDDSNPFHQDLESFRIAIQKNVSYEPEDFYNYDSGDNLAGVLQRVGDKARWGNEWFNLGTGKNQSGGTIANTIGTNMTSLVNDIQNTGCDTWTPLAEAYYVGMQYFKQEDPEDDLDYPNNAVPNANQGDDPFYDNGYVACADSFVILLTDGASTKDSKIPASIDETALKDHDGDGNDNTDCNESTGANCDYSYGGTDYLDDVALYARTHDLRTDLDGDQNLILYTIYAFGDDSDAENLLKDAAKNGGFEDRNGNKIPDLQDEWDVDGDGDPDTFYKASDGYLLESKLIQAINDILTRAAAGTAVSVLSTTGEGEASLFRAYFRPVVREGLTEVNWLGYLQSLWVDSHGNLREDTVLDRTLNVGEDKVITYVSDSGTGDTKVRRFAVSQQDPYPDVASDPYEEVALEDISPIWEAGSRLAQRSAGDRKIFTYLDKDKDGQVDESIYNSFDALGEVVKFHTDSAPHIKPYFGVMNDSAWSYLGATHEQRVSNLIDFVRGTDVAGLRSRTIDSKVWKLGDIVSSTPISISKPPDFFHVIYGDESYNDYYEANKARETVVFVGGNDGMLHAFTSWKFDPETGAYTKPDSAPVTEQIGDELWAYIPQSLLPHMKWLASPSYTHVDYVDLKPKIFDAKIDHDNNAITPREWRTILIAGLNMGGKHIWAEGDFEDGSGGTLSETRHFYPSYVCMDVTDPRNPKLLWERTYTDLEMTTSVPAAVKVKEKWFAVFGSGPSDYDATTTKKGHIYVVDLETGAPYRNGSNDWLFETGEAKAFMNSPISLDKNLNFSVDAIYFGETYLSGSWKGKLYKVSVPAVDASGDYDASSVNNYVDDPLDPINPWTVSALFNATKPITAPVTVAVDAFDNTWLYAGSGRYLGTGDKTSTDTQYMFGIKDPFFNSDHTPTGLYGTNYYHNYGSSLELQISDLFDANDYVIIQGGQSVYDDNDNLVGTFNDMLTLARKKNGWVRTLETDGERVTEQSAVLGGMVFTPSFVPNTDVCGFGGDSYLYGLYYETGTAYYDPAFDGGIKTTSINGEDMTEVVCQTGLGSGKASSVGIHVGTQSTKALLQQTTGAIVTEDLDPAFSFKSSLRSWVEK